MGVPHPGAFLEVMNRRSELLRVLGDGAMTKPKLESELDVSRSTVDRAIRELEDKQLVERTDAGYRRTLSGRLALRDYEGFTRRISGLCEGSDLLAGLPPSVEVDTVFLEDADVVEADKASPHRPIEELYGYVEAASEVRGFAPAIHPQQVETYRRQVLESGMGVEVIVSDDAVERLLSEYEGAFEAALATDRASFYRSTSEFPYSLTIATLEDRPVAGLMIYGRSGIRGCIINDAEPAVEWAERRFRAERKQASQLGA
jgi:predicted transcriptional regulator